MRNTDKQYHDLAAMVLEKGHTKTDRTETGTISMTGALMRFDLQKEFPILTTKRVFWKGVVAELLMFIRGYTSEHWLQEQGVHIWDEWPATQHKYIPYGMMWRSVPTDEIVLTEHSGIQRDMFEGPEVYTNVDVKRSYYDQLGTVIQELKVNPDSRRLLVNAWQVEFLSEFTLPPCHNQFQFTTHPVNDKRYLNCQVYQRSVDVLLGLPFNLASYALLTHIVAKECGYEVGELVWTGCDVHIYNNHVEQVKTQLTRDSKSNPQLRMFQKKALEEYEVSDFILMDYDPHPAIKADVAV